MSWNGQHRQRPALLASADMTRAKTRALRPTDAGRIEGILRRFGALWADAESPGREAGAKGRARVADRTPRA